MKGIGDIKELLKRNGIQPSFHRIRILEYLRDHRGHPTAEDIHRELSKEIPTLSKTTVYNALNLFSEKGIVEALLIDGREALYDLPDIPHSHFMCLKCGKIIDVNYRIDLRKGEEIDGNLITEVQVYLRGICKNCLNSIDK